MAFEFSPLPCVEKELSSEDRHVLELVGRARLMEEAFRLIDQVRGWHNKALCLGLSTHGQGAYDTAVLTQGIVMRLHEMAESVAPHVTKVYAAREDVV